MGLADLAASMGATPTLEVTIAPEHPAIPLLERAIAQLRQDHPRAAADYIVDVMSACEAALDSIEDRDDVACKVFAEVIRTTLT